MGASTAATMVALWLKAAGNSVLRIVGLSLGGLALLAFREVQPVFGGGLLGVAIAGGAWQTLRTKLSALPGAEQRWIAWALVGVALAASLSPHGPWAYALGRGRLRNDLSEFAWPAASLLIVSGVLATGALSRGRAVAGLPSTRCAMIFAVSSSGSSVGSRPAPC